MKYRITLDSMEFRAYHGCYELEQKVGNRFQVDLQLVTELGQVAELDRVEIAVNYLEVYEVVREVMTHTQRTIERVAMNIIERVKSRFPQVESVSCTVAKMAPPLGGKLRSVSVTLEA
ncbi:MAG: dihydroneopterin aldolase [Alistipes sp.]|nr:dihydroneopterin aldolase [Alistipes sp.]